ncbi:MAG: hypothetical protein RJB39_797 [Candidatus Parcubacteria bacterium]|jgi:hypothetical protein
MQKTFSPIARLALLAAFACLPSTFAYGATAAATTPIETLNFGAQAQTATKKAPAVVPDLYVNLGDFVTINIRSYAVATTPIEIYFLTFDEDGTPLQKLFLGNVKNPQVGVFKKYKLGITEALLETALGGHAEYMQVGYCVGGCAKSGSNRLIKGKVILPHREQLSSDNLGA